MRTTFPNGGHKQDHSAAVADTLTKLIQHPTERCMLPVLDLDPTQRPTTAAAIPSRPMPMAGLNVRLSDIEPKLKGAEIRPSFPKARMGTS